MAGTVAAATLKRLVGGRGRWDPFLGAALRQYKMILIQEHKLHSYLPAPKTKPNPLKVQFEEIQKQNLGTRRLFPGQEFL